MPDDEGEWWSCHRIDPPCTDRAVVFPALQVMRSCGDPDCAGGPDHAIAVICLAIPLCGPCSTVIEPKNVANPHLMSFLAGALAMKGLAAPKWEEIRIRMVPLEHWTDSAGARLPPKTWRHA